MRKVALFFCLITSFVALADKELSISDYAREIRAKVRGKIFEALNEKGTRGEIDGVVTFSGEGSFFLQRDNDGLKIMAEGAGSLPEAGDSVVVSGRPSLEGGRVVFVCEKWGRESKVAMPMARSADFSERFNWQRVKISGRAMAVTETGFALEVNGSPANVVVKKVPDFVIDSAWTHPKVEVTGVLELLIDQSSLVSDNADIIGARINVSGADDIRLIGDAAYFAASRSRMLMKAGMWTMVALGIGVMAFLVVIIRQRRRMFKTRTIMAERKRMADDIHDTIEQHLVGAGMLLKLNRIKEAQDVLVRAKAEIRDVVWGLKNDDMLRLSPAEMLRKLAHIETTKGICRVETKLAGLPNEMDASAMRDLSLIVRESIGNAIKHGGAKKIAISSDPGTNGGWVLRVANDGVQFDPESAPGAKEGHFGLEGMRQRARRLGATVSIVRRKQGMVVILERKS